MIKTRCNRCRALIDYGNTYCENCRKVVNREKKKCESNKKKEADKLTNTSRWRSLKRQILLRDKCCRLCLKRDKYINMKSLEVHHIYKRSCYPHLAYNENNLVTLCVRCHKEIEDISVEKQFELLGLEDTLTLEDEGIEFYL